MISREASLRETISTAQQIKSKLAAIANMQIGAGTKFVANTIPSWSYGAVLIAPSAGFLDKISLLM